MEQLLHYCWKHKIWPIDGLQTTDGQKVEVIDPGLHNRNSGPDFFNAKVKINGTLWVGKVKGQISAIAFVHGVCETWRHFFEYHFSCVSDLCYCRPQVKISRWMIQLSILFLIFASGVGDCKATLRPLGWRNPLRQKKRNAPNLRDENVGNFHLTKDCERAVRLPRICVGL